MAFKFIVKDEDLPKPTTLSITHVVSILFAPFLFGTGKIPIHILVTFTTLEIIQVIYSAVFYKKIVWERYTNTKLRTVTISFISVNLYLTVVSLLTLVLGNFISLSLLLVSIAMLFTSTLLFTAYLRKIDAHNRIKAFLKPPKDFSFPFYKFTAVIPMFLILSSIFIKSKIYYAVSIALLALGFFYTALGEYYNTKKKDELDRLIKYQASYVAMQFLPAVFIPLFLVETLFKVQVPWFYILVIFVFGHELVQAFINKKYE